MFTLEFDNPGKGDCLFYGFGEGLFDIIKHQYAQKGISSTFNHLKELDPSFNNSLNDILMFDYHNQKLWRDLLEKIQVSLRNILFNQRKQPLIDLRTQNQENDTKLLGDTTYQKFAELVFKAAKIPSDLPFYNDFIDSKAAKNLRAFAQQTAQNIKDNNVDQHNTIILAAFRQNLFGNSEIGKVDETSSIFVAMKDITRKTRWGTMDDAPELARIFDVNLHKRENNREKYAAVDIPGKPILTLNNKFNVHWTTHLHFLNPGFKGKTYEKFFKDSAITKAEIKAIFLSYTQGFMSAVTKRNYLNEANTIINLCDNAEAELSVIIKQVNYVNTGIYNKNSSFKKRADYVIARANYHNEAPVLSKEEIQNAMVKYLERSWCHHRKIALDTLRECNNAEKTVQDIVDKLTTYKSVRIPAKSIGHSS